MEKLLNALKVDQNGYESIVFQQWFNWCGKNSKTPEEWQSLLANTALFNWWKKQYEVYEKEFLQEIKPYVLDVSPRDAYLLYIKNVYQIQLHFSKPLMNGARMANIYPSANN